jgi:hypothetical protein
MTKMKFIFKTDVFETTIASSTKNHLVKYLFTGTGLFFLLSILIFL